MNATKRRRLVSERIAAGDEKARLRRAAHALDCIEEDRSRPLDLGAGPGWSARFEYATSRLAPADARRLEELASDPRVYMPDPDEG